MSEIVEHQDNAIEAVHTDSHAHPHSDTVHVPLIGDVTAPGGIYTVVFGALAGLTILEVLIAELGKGFEEGIAYTVRTLALFSISLLKALLVVWFYMHLKQDNPIFRYVLIVPIIVVTISVLYLLGVPIAAGMGYR
jgi:caa(3)-type oxidase subunit IV